MKRLRDIKLFILPSCPRHGTITESRHRQVTIERDGKGKLHMRGMASLSLSVAGQLPGLCPTSMGNHRRQSPVFNCWCPSVMYDPGSGRSLTKSPDVLGMDAEADTAYSWHI